MRHAIIGFPSFMMMQLPRSRDGDVDAGKPMDDAVKPMDVESVESIASGNGTDDQEGKSGTGDAIHTSNPATDDDVDEDRSSEATHDFGDATHTSNPAKKQRTMKDFLKKKDNSKQDSVKSKKKILETLRITQKKIL